MTKEDMCYRVENSNDVTVQLFEHMEIRGQDMTGLAGDVVPIFQVSPPPEAIQLMHVLQVA